MSYSAKITYPIYDLNSSLFLELIRDILEKEFTSQRSLTFGKTFLPKSVKADEYLLSPISDKEIYPAFCSIIKAKMESTEQRIFEQNNNLNGYIIGVLADGLTNLRKITDAIYVILNDMDVKEYIFSAVNSAGDTLISDSAKYQIKNLSTEYEVSKTMNDQNIVYGSLLLQAEISEVVKYNNYSTIEGIDLQLKLGENETELNQQTDL